MHLADDGALHLLLQHHRCRIDADVVGAEGHGLNDLDGKKHVDVCRPRHRDNAQRNKNCGNSDDWSGAESGNESVREHERQQSAQAGESDDGSPNYKIHANLLD